MLDIPHAIRQPHRLGQKAVSTLALSSCTAKPYNLLDRWVALPYSSSLQSVIQTATFLVQAKRCGLTDDALQEVVAVIAADPKAGVLMAGTGGARKLRHAREGQGQSGGFRTIHYFGGDDIPVFALAIYGKNEKGNLSKAERNELASILPKLADAYRQRKDKA